MASFDQANAVATDDADDFIPEVWSMETLASYQKNLVMAALVTVVNHQGKKGDTIHIPVPARGAALQKSITAAAPIVPIAFSSTTTDILLNQHWYYARLLEDITEMQGLASLRQFFTKDAGYSLATRVDTVLHNLAATWGGATAYVAAGGAVIGGDGSTAYSATSAGNGTALSDAGVRRVIQTLDDNDVPGRDRVLVIPPIEKRRLLGEARFTEQAFTGEVGQGNSIRNGLVGDLYGVEVYVSSNCASTTAADTTTVYRVCLMFQKEAICLAEQLMPRAQQQYKLESFGTLMATDTIFGAATLRGAASGDAGAGCKAIIVPST